MACSPFRSRRWPLFPFELVAELFWFHIVDSSSLLLVDAQGRVVLFDGALWGEAGQMCIRALDEPGVQIFHSSRYPGTIEAYGSVNMSARRLDEHRIAFSSYVLEMGEAGYGSLMPFPASLPS